MDCFDWSRRLAITPRIFVTGTSVNFCPATTWLGAAAGGAEGADAAAGFGVTETFSRSLAVTDPSNPEPRVTEAREIPFSAANFRASGDANTLSEEVDAA